MPAAAKKSEKISAETLASVAELAVVLGLSSNRIYQLSQEGIITSILPIWAGIQSPKTR